MKTATKTASVTTQAQTQTLNFTQAKRMVRKLGFKSHQAYTWARVDKRLPAQLPVKPQDHYARYWKGWGDFLGTSVAKTSEVK